MSAVGQVSGECSAQPRGSDLTSPTGCTLGSLEIQRPQAGRLGKLVEELGLGSAVREAAAEEMILTLACPAGRVALSRPSP